MVNYPGRTIRAVFSSILFTLLLACQGSASTILRAQFTDLVYYSGAMDIYFESEQQERKFRVSTDAGNFADLFEQFIAAGGQEGPPDIDESKVGQWYCLEVDAGQIVSLSPATGNGQCF